MGTDKLPVNRLKPVDSHSALAGHVGHLTQQQQDALESFKHRLASAGYYSPPGEGHTRPSHDDVTLTRFLRARKFDVEGAYTQFTTAEDWRRTEGVDALYDSFDISEFEQARELYPQWTGRRDRAGLPVYVFEVGALDKRKTDKYAKEGDRAEPRLIALYEHMVQFVLPFCSAVPHQHPETPISGCATIVDVSNVSLMRFWALKAHMQRASVLATARYAETLGAIYLVGAPSFFATVWGWVKNWFDPGTVDKINILAAGTMLQDLEARIPRESIPRKYGGELDWAYGARGPALDDEARRTMGAREGEDVAGLLSAPVRWVDGKVVLKGKGRSDAELERWNDGGRTDAGTEPAGRGEPAERGATAAAAAAAAPSATLNGDAHAEEEIEPAPQPSPPASSAPSSSSPSPSPAPASAFASSTTSTPASTTTHTTPRTDDSSAVLPPSSASVSTSALPPPILGAGYSNARPASSSPSHSLAATPAPKAAEQGHAKGEEEQHDIHVAARENPAAPVKDLAAALEGTTL